ncbi:MAG: 50S ribosomal protein L3, partial [Nanoarchaeota archaeon]
MPVPKRPRFGSLQFYPRKRAAKFLPRVNWAPLSDNSESLSGFIAYKAGMATAVIKDSTDKVQSAGKIISIPVTVLEIPHMKIFSVRFYKHGQVIDETVVSNDKDLKKVLKVSKATHKLDKVPEGYDDIRVLVYSLVKTTSIKKTPDLAEIAINSQDKLEFVKNHIDKELSFSLFPKSSLVDIRGLTKGKGLQGPIKRFGLGLKGHKSEKGVRRPGSLGPWHPARVTFRTPMAGQMGLFTRISYNLKLISSGNVSEKDINPKSGFQ